MSRPLTDSPWFWLYLFATVGLGLLLLVGPRWIEKQSRLERRAAGYRQPALEPGGGTVGDSSPTAVQGMEQESTARSWRRYRAVLALLATVVAAGWIAFWWSRLRPRPVSMSS